jgi:hypothetical protein
MINIVLVASDYQLIILLLLLELLQPEPRSLVPGYVLLVLELFLAVEGLVTVSPLLYLVKICWFLDSRIKTVLSPRLMAARNILTISSTIYVTWS